MGEGKGWVGATEAGWVSLRKTPIPGPHEAPSRKCPIPPPWSKFYESGFPSKEWSRRGSPHLLVLLPHAGSGDLSHLIFGHRAANRVTLRGRME
ncbi:hypothetical protein AAY473_018249 [Plecturocebus cupreus]